MRRERLLTTLLRLAIRYPKLFIVALLLGGLSYMYEVFIARDTMCFKGVPQALDARSEHWTRVFRNRAYMVGYSDIKANPLWVVYKLTPSSSETGSLKRPESFSRDWRNLGLIAQEDYTNSGYDRGHMAPNFAIARLYGKTAQYETFLMTNITPQKPSLNQKIWQRLEEAEIETFAPKYKVLWVYTGPLFEGRSQTLKSSAWIQVPSAFYKFYVGIDANNQLHTFGVIIPQNAKPNDSLERYAVSIDEIERRSGFDFLCELDDALEEKIEASQGEKWF
ncbi:DNA/RNA non-specific endonuclease [Sulfurospirillum cavolei]|uniref:DNA/RNA non-specific endonuclease n=1 Tax=Sulfurospirillum cavolei TaxID=366522 RepID=UPI0005A68A39|nr:DNA/RNA non-specific endonuclease [Sulfurospirillum cavolei]